MYKRNSHCSFCGAPFEENQPWPRRCHRCEHTTYLNPLPVAVVLLPVGTGLLTVRRTIPPHEGKLALPGGYIGAGESWQEAAARELWEETGIKTNPLAITDFRVRSAPDGTLLVFGLAQPVMTNQLPAFRANQEASEWVILQAPEELAFDLHTEAVKEYFARKDGTQQVKG